MKISEDQARKIAHWHEIKTEAANAVELERILRVELIDMMFQADKTEGSETIHLSNGARLVATKKMSYTLDQSKLGELRLALPEEIEKELFRRKYELVLSVFKHKLPAVLDGLRHEDRQEIEELFAEALTIKPAMPNLELKYDN